MVEVLMPGLYHETKKLPKAPDAKAPDGCDVRILLGLPRGTMAHFELASGLTSIAVTHRTVEEIWYFLSGRGQMWRSPAAGSEFTNVSVPFNRR